MSKGYLPGNGLFQVGERVRYVGKGHGYVDDVAIGTLATVTHDAGFDYRYTMTFDAPTRTIFSDLHPDGEYGPVDSIRCGASGWSKV